MGVIRLAVDAMGGDFAPAEIVAGAVRGARDFNLGLSLVGDLEAIQQELDHLETNDVDFEIVHARDVIRMEDDPARAVRDHPDASINVSCRLVNEGRADGVLTMGHTGAGMIAALFNFGRISGVERPAAIVPFLGLREHLYLIDVGANTEVRPSHLLQFAQMGAAYAKYAGGIPNPCIGLLSNGAEPNKGNKVGREAYQLLANAKGLNFGGNVEGHTMLSGEFNLIVSDGFAGNLVFKAAQGIVARLLSQVEAILPELPPEPASILKIRLEEIREFNHYSHYGASTLLGVNHPMFIGHGRSRAQAVYHGMSTAGRMIAADVVGKIRDALSLE
jgi:glycerol-3-phosphate acyltransferase PlsX